MSFAGFKPRIETGDTVILFINPHRMHAVEVKSKRLNKNSEEIDNVFQTQYGALNVESLIGKEFGCKIMLPKGWIYVLHPTCELWTQTLPHRTQIIYTPDISLILFHLDLKPGDVVLEAGTGSGSLTHALARTVSPNGHVHSFDFHETRVSIAEVEFKNHGLSPVVSVSQRDVCRDGYGEDMMNVADAVFLDLPLPWEAVPHAVNAIKKSGGRFASFSPCIEQVQKTCTMLRGYGFGDIDTLECLQREFTVVNRSLPVLSLDSVGNEGENKNEAFVAALPPLTMPGHTGFLTFATLPPIHSRPLIERW